MRVSFFAVCFYGRGGAVNISAAAAHCTAHTYTLSLSERTPKERETHTRAIILQIKGNGLRQRPQCVWAGGFFLVIGGWHFMAPEVIF